MAEVLTEISGNKARQTIARPTYPIILVACNS